MNRRRAYEAKDKQPEVLESLESVAWEREQTLTSEVPLDWDRVVLVCVLLRGLCHFQVLFSRSSNRSPHTYKIMVLSALRGQHDDRNRLLDSSNNDEVERL